MSHIDVELKQLKTDLIRMWELVIRQLESARIAIEKFDKVIVAEVTENEKRLDEYELKINRDCENVLALYNPLANDLRFVLAVLKINYNLERIGDYCKSLAKLIKHAEKPYKMKCTEEAQIFPMFQVCQEMLNDALEAFEKEDNNKAMSIFAKDEKLDRTNKNANKIISALIKEDPKDVLNLLDILSMIRKLERVGDQTKNISEEIVFYIEAKQIRHTPAVKIEKVKKSQKKKEE